MARSVVAAIRQIGQKRPSAVIFDWALPDMPGIELLRYVKRDSHTQSTPLIVITKEKNPEITREALEAGADVVLAEPLSIKELQHIVTMCVNQPELGTGGLETKVLLGTAPLQAIQPQRRRNSLVLFIAGSKEPMVLTLTQPITFGRSVSKALQTHVDLTRHNAVDNGVSRIHARLNFNDNNFFVEDLNSVNGTYLNGEPLRPSVPAPLKSADEVRLGRLRMTVYFLEDSETPE
jgi:CheY-like chemotaxis protein